MIVYVSMNLQDTDVTLVLRGLKRVILKTHHFHAFNTYVKLMEQVVMSII
jgi:hypothetical protein